MPAGLIARRPVEVPPTAWIDDMRTPPADIILQEFHRQKYCVGEGMADGQENASPNTDAMDAATADSPDTGQHSAGLLMHFAARTCLKYLSCTASSYAQLQC